MQEEEDENEEAEAENQEGKLAWAGGRKEEVTYEAGDAEDTAIAAAAQRAAQQQDDGPDVSPDVSTQPVLLLRTACVICQALQPSQSSMYCFRQNMRPASTDALPVQLLISRPPCSMTCSLHTAVSWLCLTPTEDGVFHIISRGVHASLSSL